MKKTLLCTLMVILLCGGLAACSHGGPEATPTPTQTPAADPPTWEPTQTPAAPISSPTGEPVPPSGGGGETPTPMPTPEPTAPPPSQTPEPASSPTPEPTQEPGPSDQVPDTALTAAGLKADTVLFADGLTAGEYLASVMEGIAALERRDEALGVEFNWFHTLEDGTTYLNSVRYRLLLDREIVRLSERGVATYLVEPTEAFTNFDVQVFYSRYIDLTGEIL